MKHSFKDRLQQALDKNNMKAVELSNITHISKALISGYLNGKYVARQDKLTLLGEALNVSEFWLMGYDVPMQREQKNNLEDVNEIQEEEKENKTEKKGVEIRNDLFYHNIAKKLVGKLLDENKAFSLKEANKIIDEAKSMINDIAFIYYG